MNKINNILHWCWNKIKAFWPWYKGLYYGRAWYTKTAIGIASFFAALIIYLGMVDMNFLWLFGKSPGFTQIMHPNTSEASEIYSADGKMLMKQKSENAVNVSSLKPGVYLLKTTSNGNSQSVKFIKK